MHAQVTTGTGPKTGERDQPFRVEQNLEDAGLPVAVAVTIGLAY